MGLCTDTDESRNFPQYIFLQTFAGSVSYAGITPTREIQADIIVLENETLFDSRKFREMGDIGKLMEDQFLSLLSYVAEQERKKIKQRQAEGIAIAKAKGKHLGRLLKIIAILCFLNIKSVP